MVFGGAFVGLVPCYLLSLKYDKIGVLPALLSRLLWFYSAKNYFRLHIIAIQPLPFCFCDLDPIMMEIQV